MFARPRRAWTPLVPRHASRDQRRAADRARRRQRRRQRAEPAGHRRTRWRPRRTPRRSPACVSRRCSIRRCPSRGRGATRTGTSASRGVQVFAAPASDPAKRTRVDFTTVKGDGNVVARRPARPDDGRAGRVLAARQGVGRRCRPRRLARAVPARAGAEGADRLRRAAPSSRVDDRPRGRHARTGPRPLPPVHHDGRRAAATSSR